MKWKIEKANILEKQKPNIEATIDRTTKALHFATETRKSKEKRRHSVHLPSDPGRRDPERRRVLEGTNATEEEVREFGENTLEAVQLLTKKDGKYGEKYVRIILTNWMAAVVKSADKIHNVWDISYLGMRVEERPEKKQRNR